MKDIIRGSVEVSEVDMGSEVQYVQLRAALGDDCCSQYIDDPVEAYTRVLANMPIGTHHHWLRQSSMFPYLKRQHWKRMSCWPCLCLMTSRRL